MPQRRASIAALAVLALFAAVVTEGREPPGTAEDRAALFDEIVEKTYDWTAFSPYNDIERSYRTTVAPLRQAFIDASTEADLFYALIRLSNLRKDRHLSVDPIDNGLRVPDVDLQAPVTFATDYGTPGRYTLFVSDYATDLAPAAGGQAPDVGDRLIAVNGTPLDDYAARLTPYARYSTTDKLWWEIARLVSRKSSQVGPELYAADVTYRLERRDGRVYTLQVSYRDPATITWRGFSVKRYPGFKKAIETPSYTLYVPERPDRAILLDWNGFVRSVRDDTDTLIAYARQHDLLDHDLIVDTTGSGGGSQGAYVLAHLSSKPFRTTFGNIRLSDVTPRFIAEVKKDRPGTRDVEAHRRLVAWLDGEVTRDLKQGKPYSEKVPFKLAHLPRDSDGIMQPAATHFTGHLVVLTGPSGGSHLDQFLAMVVDNDLGYTIGTPPAGHSNTWEWTETLRFKSSGRPVVSYMWNIGHTIRPNGEVLEANPVRVHDRHPVTRENYLTYYDEAVERALSHLKGSRTANQ